MAAVLACVILIFLFIISQNASARIIHHGYYRIDIDLSLLGITLYFPKTTRSEDEEKDKRAVPDSSIIFLIKHILSYSTVTIHRFSTFPSHSDTPITLLPAYVVTFSLLSLIVNGARKCTVENHAHIRYENSPNIDLTLKIPIYHLIISLLRYQYYSKTLRRREARYGK